MGLASGKLICKSVTNDIAFFFSIHLIVHLIIVRILYKFETYKCECKYYKKLHSSDSESFSILVAH